MATRSGGKSSRSWWRGHLDRDVARTAGRDVALTIVPGLLPPPPTSCSGTGHQEQQPGTPGDTERRMPATAMTRQIRPVCPLQIATGELDGTQNIRSVAGVFESRPPCVVHQIVLRCQSVSNRARRKTAGVEVHTESPPGLAD